MLSSYVMSVFGFALVSELVVSSLLSVVVVLEAVWPVVDSLVYSLESASVEDAVVCSLCCAWLAADRCDKKK